MCNCCSSEEPRLERTRPELDYLRSKIARLRQTRRGLSLSSSTTRAMLSGFALDGLLSTSRTDEMTQDHLVSLSVQYADMLMEELERE